MEVFGEKMLKKPGMYFSWLKCVVCGVDILSKGKTGKHQLVGRLQNKRGRIGENRVLSLGRQ